MTTFIKYFTFFVLFFCLMIVAQAQSAKNENYIVLLDLSDRLLTVDQTNRDKRLIQDVFARFEGIVRQKFIINSNDCFKVVVAPQQGGIITETYENELYISMAEFNIQQKRKQLEAFKANLPKVLDKLYADATKGRKSSKDFSGTDIWKYFNDFLVNDVINTHQNKLFVLTDGYFDFESNRFVGQLGNRTTDSRVLNKLRNDSDWEKKLHSINEGLIPVKKNFGKLSVCLLEVKPKFQNLNEQDLLVAVWRKWLSEMKINSFTFSPHGSLPATQKKIYTF
ncbi:hypothetical protein [Emticicia sp. W12TSBA100-4]|uniref:hypothetical protein n=1 Tax=Emticicia sp. W12TSBA100-4 TaxID=3160965 RepID=UPI0033067AB5